MISRPTGADRPIRLGIVGAGRWGRNIIKTVASLPLVELAGVVSRNPTTQGLVPADCPVVADWREFIARIPMDGIVIATPPATHCAIAQASIVAGLHTLIEKPLSLNLEEAENTLALAQRHNRLALTEFTQLFNPKFRTLMASLPMLKGIRFILSRAGNFGPFRTDTPVLWDWGAHELSMLMTLTASAPLSISAQRVAQGNGEHGEESIWKIDCSFASGVRSQAVIGNMMPRCRKLAVIGAAGALVFDDVGETPLSYYPGHHPFEFPDGRGEEILVADMTAPLARAILEFAAAIRTDRISGDSAQLGVEVVRQLSFCTRAG